MASIIRITLELVSVIEDRCSKLMSEKPLKYFDRFSNRYIDIHQRKHSQAQGVLAEVLQGARHPRPGQSLCSTLNLYLLARTNTQDAAMHILARVQKLVLILWQAGGRPNIPLAVSDNHPAQTCIQWVRHIRELIQTARRGGRHGPYGDANQLFSATMVKVANRTLGTMSGWHYDHENYVLHLLPVKFTDNAVRHTGTPAVDATVGTGSMPTGSTLSAGVVLKHSDDLDNMSLWIVGDIREGGSLVSLFLADRSAPSNLARTNIDDLHITNVTIQFYTIQNGAGTLKHHDIYRRKCVHAGEGAYITSNAIFRIAGSAEQLPHFDGDIFRRTEHRSSHVASISSSFGELDE